MATLKGSNLRIGTLNTTTNKFTVYGMATSCSITQTANTDSAKTKDDVGLADKPEITSKSWQVSVESLSVADVGALLTAMKNQQKLTLMWDETSTTDNQTAQKAAFARYGEAYLSDATFNFNNRENSSKSLQFTGAAPLYTVPQDTTTEVISAGAYTKGQYVRLFISETSSPALVVGAAQSLSLHVSLGMEAATTKDTTGDFEVQEPTTLNYDITSGALVRSGETITSSVNSQALSDLQEYYEANDLMYWQIANVSGANNRTKGAIIVSGRCYITQLQADAAVGSNASYQASLTGYGDYTVGA